MQTRLGLKQQLKVAPQQVLVSTLLQAALVDLDGLIAQELAENPALERAHAHATWDDSPLVVPGQTTGAQGENAGALDDWAEQVVDQPSLTEQLTTQLTLLADGPRCELAVALLDYLDDHGYLRATVATLTQELAVEPAALETAIQLLHTLEPPGIGARDLRECLQIQCAHLAADGVDCALVRRILTGAWDAFCREQWTAIARQLQVSRTAVSEAQHFIRRHLYPYPLALISHPLTPTTAPVCADLVIQRRISMDAYVYSIEIAAPVHQRLQINSGFADMLRTASQRDSMVSSETRWLHSHIQRARHFIAALHQRWATLYRIGAYLITYQQAFLTEGALSLKPLTQAMVAAALGLHEATISRAVHDKYVQLPDGRLLALTAFFDHTLPAKEIMRQVLAAANRPLSDQEIADCLHDKGIILARRTVAKYREQLKIPVSYCR